MIDAVTAVAAIAAVCTAWRAMYTWKKQKKAALVEEIIVTALEFESMINYVRSLERRPEEGTSRILQHNEPPDDCLRRNELYIPLERFHARNYQQQKWKFLSLKFRADLHFKDVIGDIEMLMTIADGVYSASADRYLANLENNLDRNNEDHNKFLLRCEELIFEKEKGDKIKISAQAHVRSIKEMLEEYL